jgi:hypothetical protein
LNGAALAESSLTGFYFVALCFGFYACWGRITIFVRWGWIAITTDAKTVSTPTAVMPGLVVPGIHGLASK